MNTHCTSSSRKGSIFVSKIVSLHNSLPVFASEAITKATRPLSLGAEYRMPFWVIGGTGFGAVRLPNEKGGNKARMATSTM